jgi:DNA polymerase III gamma/tau subunit
MTTEALHDKYRPVELDDVSGHDAVIKSIKRIVQKRASHCFLITGPSGLGKTTIARCIAYALGAGVNDIEDVDAALYSGKDDVRLLLEKLAYRPFGDSSIRCFVMDECHRMSAAAWASLLKSTEEPPDWAFWFFCTTEPAKVPEAICTRSTRYDLKPLSVDTLLDYIVAPVAQAEAMEVDEKILRLCAVEAHGSPRQALVNLAVCGTAESVEEAAQLLSNNLSGVQDAAAVIALARLFFKNTSWAEAQTALAALKEESPETVRRVIDAYFTKALLGAKGPQQAKRALAVLGAFNSPATIWDRMSLVVLATSRLITP